MSIRVQHDQLGAFIDSTEGGRTTMIRARAVVLALEATNGSVVGAVKLVFNYHKSESFGLEQAKNVVEFVLMAKELKEI